MRKLLYIVTLLLVASCNQSKDTETENEVVIDEISASDTYQKYVESYEDYKSCKQERPQWTQDYMDKKISADEFREGLQTNTRVCNLKKNIFDQYYRLLQAEFGAEANTYKIKES